MKKILFLLAGLLYMFASCSDGGSDNPVDPEPTPSPEEKASITLNSTGLTFSAQGGEQSITFTTNMDWTLSVAPTTSGATWCTASATSGSKGNASVKFTATENADYNDRSVSVTIKAGTASKTFTVTQKGADALLVTSATFNVEQAGGTIEVEVKANINYQLEVAETAKSWITESNTRALTTKKHRFTIAPSEELEKREGEIYIKSGDKQETVKVYQAGGAILMLSKNEYAVSSEGETITVDLKSNTEYDVKLPEVDWIHDLASTRGMSSHTLQYVVDANETYDSRSAEIIFLDKNSDLKDTLKIIQAQKDAIIISQKEYEVKAEGETIEVKLSANVDYEVTMPDADWVSQVQTRGLTEHTLYFSVAENTSEGERKTEIAIINKDSQLSESIIINQEGALQAGYTDGVVCVKTGGTMKELLDDDYLSITTLKVVGYINGDDVYCLRKMLGATNFSEAERGKLTILDLSEATIVEGGGWYYEIASPKKQYHTSNNIVGRYMFAECLNLQNIILPNNTSSIDVCAFYLCNALASIVIPDAVISIGTQAFQACI
ncbi:MAG: leucine-rich repeat protein [Bacteroides sp.]|nr:leucine-rich repeat protein [Bacteroides sp.]